MKSNKNRGLDKSGDDGGVFTMIDLATFFFLKFFFLTTLNIYN
jgi:hypothetical protein